MRFRRTDGMLALPTPAADGSIALLRQYVNLNDLEFCLLIGWMTAARAHRPLSHPRDPR